MKILINLCAVLAIALVVFLAGIDRRENEVGCIASAILLQYFLLSVWCWMAVYANVLYLSLVKVPQKKINQTRIKHLTCFKVE